MATPLALLEGRPAAVIGWPQWPQPAPAALDNLRQVLESGRWALSGPYQEGPSMERRFAAAFARFHDVPYCVPAASGTASLTIALEAIGLRPGDEVIVPGLTWVACATAVANLGAVPVLVDVDPRTLCLAAEAVSAAVTPRTAAVLAVHLYSAVADLRGLTAVAERHGLALIEDCAHLHGAAWRCRKVGTWGAAGTFSMQHGKILTSGEGGAVITADSGLHRRLQQLRADGRIYLDEPPRRGEMELLEVGEVTGSNRCLSEFQAAVLLAQLEVLEEQNRRREVNAQRLDALLSAGGWRPQATSEGTTERSYYRYAVALPDGELDEPPLPTVVEALSRELGFTVTPIYPPLGRNPLYRPASRPRYRLGDGFLERVDPSRFELPECERAHRRWLALPHSVLLAAPKRMELIAEAFARVRACRDRLAEFARSRAPVSGVLGNP